MTERSSGSGLPLMVTVSGCRGVVGASLTPEVVVRYVGAFVRWLRETRGRDDLIVVLGRDGRQGGDTLRRLAAGALSASGARVIDLAVAMTPTVGVMVGHHGADGGLMITASHNPQQWNGLKAITAEGRAPGPRDAARIVELFQSGQTALARHDEVGVFNADDTAAHVHVARVLKAIGDVVAIERIREQGFKVVVDSVNASGALGARLLLDALGCEVVHINHDQGGVFPHEPEPVAEHLTALSDKTRDVGAAAGFAQDPDGDRLAIVDGDGRYIGEEHTIALCAMALLAGEASGRTTLIAVNLSTSRMIDDIAAKHGATVLRTPVGEANVVEGMTSAERVMLGGEGNGGVIWPPVCLIRDSLSAMALTLALLTMEGRSIAEILAETPRYAIVKRKTPAPAAGPEAALAAAAGCFDGGEVDQQDGVRIDFPERRAWVQVRASNTEPILRIIAEAPDQAEADRLVDEAIAAIAAGGDS